MKFPTPSPDICQSASVPRGPFEVTPAEKFIDQVKALGGRSLAVKDGDKTTVFYSGTISVESKS